MARIAGNLSGPVRDTVTRLLPTEVDRIVRLADRLRLMAPSEACKPTPVRLRQLLTDILATQSPLALESRVKIDLHCPDDLLPLLADPGQLLQLLGNLTRNAIEAMPDGGLVIIGAIYVSKVASETIVVRLLDEGVGVGPELRRRIFEPFFKLSPWELVLAFRYADKSPAFTGPHLHCFPAMIGPGLLLKLDFRAFSIRTDDQEPSEVVSVSEPTSQTV